MNPGNGKLRSRNAELREQIIELYNKGLGSTDIGRVLGISRGAVRLRIDDLVEEGIIERRAKSYRQPVKNRKNTIKNLYAAQINDLYKKRKTISEIATELGISNRSVSNYISEAVMEGILPAYLGKEYGKRVSDYNLNGWKLSTTPLKYKTKTVPSTLAPGQTVKCTREVSNKCVYGVSKYVTNNSGRLCRYSDVTNHCRIVICSAKACTCFSEISDDNPRINSQGEEDE